MIEILVSISIIAVLAGGMAMAFQIGLKALAPGGAGSRLAGADNFSLLEETLGRDGARATCMTFGGTVYGLNITNKTCSGGGGTHGYANVTQCNTATLCFGWPVLGTAGPNFLDSFCHVAVYTAVSSPPLSAPNAVVTRTEYSVDMSGNTAPVVSTIINHPGSVAFTSQFIALQFAPQAPQPAGYSPPGEVPAYTWFRTLPVKITASGVSSNTFTQTLAIHPVSVDPDGAAAAVTSQGPPC